MLSLLGKKWRVKNTELDKPLLERLLENREVPLELAERFFAPDYERDIHDPWLFKGMDKAVERVKQAIENGEQITILGDYDCDGVTATVVLLEVLERVGAQVDYLLPDRHKDGYGLTPSVVERLIQQEAKLVITVDCGITSVDEVAQLKAAGCDTIVTDHHAVPQELPPAVAILNARQEDCQYPFDQLAGVGVAWKLSTAIAQTMLDEAEAESLSKWQLDLVVLGTVADITPLVGENRAIAYYGLKVLAQTKRVGLQKLMEIAKIDIPRVDTTNIGYRIGPRLNAAGRIATADAALRLLRETDLERATQRAIDLDQINLDRRGETFEGVETALADLDQRIDDEVLLVVRSDDWNLGVIGLIAGRLTEQYGRPAIALTMTEDGVLTGSARAPEGVNIIKLIWECADLLTRYGGHSRAAGISLQPEDLDAFTERIRAEMVAKYGSSPLDPVVVLDTELGLEELNLENYKKAQQLQPYGEYNPEPLYLLSQVQVLKVEAVGGEQQHLRLYIQHGSQKIGGIAFGMGEEVEAVKKAGTVDLAARLSLNEWQGQQRLEVLVQDIRIKN